MKTSFNSLLFITCSFICCACSTTNAQRITSIDMMTSAANFSVVNGDTILTCDVSQLPDTLFGSFSDLCIQAGILEPMEYVVLEDSPEALVKKGRIIMSENYIMVLGREQIPHKIFSRQGKLLASIGPLPLRDDKVPVVIKASIDETQKRVFFLVHAAPYLLSYALDGSDLCIHQTNNQKPYNFILHPERSTLTLTSGIVTRKDGNYLIWEQDWKGNVLDSLPFRSTYFPNVKDTRWKETGTGGWLDIDIQNNTTAIDFSYKWRPDYVAKGDTLYHYSKEQGRLIPQFAIMWDPKIEYYWNEIVELPRHYIGRVYEKLTKDGSRAPKDQQSGELDPLVSIGQTDEDTHIRIYYLIEKSTGKAAVLRSSYGDIRGGWLTSNCRDGYYAEVEPTWYAISAIDNELGRDIPQERREKLIRIKEQLSNNKNACVRFAKVIP